MALWLIVRPYRGVRHDGVLYLGQTLGRLMPDSIGQDLFLAYGSQDRYSIFSSIMAPLVRYLGVGSSQIVALFAAGALFIFGCWKMTAGLSSSFLRWCALLSLVVVSHVYGSGGMVAFAEPFLTARVLCEPFVVLALASLLQGRPAWTAVTMTLAALIHPLITLPALATGWLYFVLQERRWLWCLAALIIPVVAGAFGIAPFDALWHRYDSQWLEAVHLANSFVFISNSSLLDWTSTALDAGMLILAARILRGSPLARLIYAALLCAVVSVVLWGVGCDLAHNVLLTQLQFWRALWLTHLLALLVLPVLLLDVWDRGHTGRWAACAIAFAVIAVTGNIANGWLCVVGAAIPLMALRSRTTLSPGIAKLAAGASVVGILIVTAVMLQKTLHLVDTFVDRFNGISTVQIVIGLTFFGAVLGFILLRGMGSTGIRRRISTVGLLALAASALSSWDQRSEWQRYVENGFQEVSLPFEEAIPPSAKVYWSESMLEVWMLAHRPEYFSNGQAAGLLFNRSTAVEFMARRRLIAPLTAKQEICATVALFTGGNLNDPDTCPPGFDDIKALCATLGGPDVLVFRSGSNHSAMGATATWAFAPDDPTRRRGYRLYDCRKLK